MLAVMWRLSSVKFEAEEVGVNMEAGLARGIERVSGEGGHVPQGAEASLSGGPGRGGTVLCTVEFICQSSIYPSNLFLC